MIKLSVCFKDVGEQDVFVSKCIFDQVDDLKIVRFKKVTTIRGEIARVEGFRFIIKKDDIDNFCNFLKE